MLKKLQELGFKTSYHRRGKTVIGAIGDNRILNSVNITTLPGVESLVPIMKPSNWPAENSGRLQAPSISAG